MTSSSSKQIPLVALLIAGRLGDDIISGNNHEDNLAGGLGSERMDTNFYKTRT